MQPKDALVRLDLPRPNPNQDYATYQNQFQPCLDFPSEELRRFFEAHQEELYPALEEHLSTELRDPRAWKRSSQHVFPSARDLTGEWYVGRVRLWQEGGAVHGVLLARFLGAPVLEGAPQAPCDYLGVLFRFSCSPVEPHFVVEEQIPLPLYLENRAFYPAGIPQDAHLCPRCCGAKWAAQDAHLGRQKRCPNCGSLGYVDAQGHKLGLGVRLRTCWLHLFWDGPLSPLLALLVWVCGLAGGMNSGLFQHTASEKLCLLGWAGVGLALLLTSVGLGLHGANQIQGFPFLRWQRKTALLLSFFLAPLFSAALFLFSWSLLPV